MSYDSHGAVGFVGGPPGDAQLVRAAHDEIAKADALDVAVDSRFEAFVQFVVGHARSNASTATSGSITFDTVHENQRGALSLVGKTLYVPMPYKTIAVEVTDLVFFDKEGGRING